MLAVLFGGGGFPVGPGGSGLRAAQDREPAVGYMENKPLPPLLTIWTNSSGRQLCGGREKMVVGWGGGVGGGLRERKRKEEKWKCKGLLKKQENIHKKKEGGKIS